MAEIRSPDRVDGKGGAVSCIFILFFFSDAAERQIKLFSALFLLL